MHYPYHQHTIILLSHGSYCWSLKNITVWGNLPSHRLWSLRMRAVHLFVSPLKLQRLLQHSFPSYTVALEREVQSYAHLRSEAKEL